MLIKGISTKCVGFIVCVTLFACGCNNLDKLHHDLPVLYITTPDADTLFIKCRQKIDAYAVLVDEKGDTLIDEQLEYIKSRGNSTFTDKEKKPFAIKFEHKKDILDLYKSKKFVLLANAFDESHIRTAIAFDLAHRIGVPAPRYAYVVLYINKKYQGLYQLTNAVEINKHSLNITDMGKANKDVNSKPLTHYPIFRDSAEGLFIKGRDLECSPTDISGGYLLGLVPFNRKECGFQACSGDWIVIEEPKHASKEEVKYIQSYYNQMERAIADTTTESYLDYIDINSFARFYLLQELLLNQDFDWVSVYFYKDANEKLCAGPIWDTDLCLGTPYWGGRVQSPNMFWANLALGPFYNASSEGLFFRIYRHQSFQDSVKRIYTEEVSSIVRDYIDNNIAQSILSDISNEIEQDYKHNGERVSRNFQVATTTPICFLGERLDFLDWFFTTSRDSMICLTDVSSTEVLHHDRKVKLYYPIGKSFDMPQPLNHKNRSHDVIPEWYICETDSFLNGRVCFMRDCDIEIRERQPSWREIRRKQLKSLLFYIQSFKRQVLKG